jgi:hypothetical protein
MTNLSPAAQAVWNAYLNKSEWDASQCELDAIAAALRAAADQVVPDQGDIWTRDLRGDAWVRWEERKLIRSELLAIAAELEALPND